MAWIESKKPWYAAGLAFECTGCGACCSGPEEGYVWVTDEEIDAAAEFMGMTGEVFRRLHVRKVEGRMSYVEKPNKDCIFLEPNDQGGKSCVIYAVRPSQCRTWPFWPMNLRSPAAWLAAQRRCEGINRGALHELQEIEDAKSNT